jgi:outer membrane protein OmpA-like peptidoglycan-associated protein
MAEGSSAVSVFFAAAIGAGIAVGGSAFAIYNITAKQRAQFETRLAAIDAKLDKTSAAVAETGKTMSLADTAKELGKLNLEIKKTNAGLVDLQNASSSDGMKNALAQLDGKIERTNAAVADLGARLQSGLAAQAASQKQALDTFAKSIEQAEVSSKQASERVTVQTKNDAMEGKTFESRELVVVYVRQPDVTADTTASIPAAPLSVRFDKIGAVDPKGQTAPIIASLKKIVKDKQDCTISIAGYADTLGGDAVNLDISRKRAEAVAAQLRIAFAGQAVKIQEVGWGERQLSVWTPDGKSENANRRVDISVACTS